MEWKSSDFQGNSVIDLHLIDDTLMSLSRLLPTQNFLASPLLARLSQRLVFQRSASTTFEIVAPKTAPTEEKPKEQKPSMISKMAKFLELKGNMLWNAHCFHVLYAFRARTPPGQHWLYTLIVPWSMTVGGSSFVSHFILKKPFPWLGNNAKLLSYFLIWALIYHSPRDAVFRFLKRTPVARSGLHVLNSLNKGNGVARNVQATLGMYGQHAVPAAMIAGTLGGSGGGFFSAWEQKTRNPRVQTTLSKPDWNVKVSAAASAAYMALTLLGAGALSKANLPIHDTGKLAAQTILLGASGWLQYKTLRGIYAKKN
eukprot:gnl/Trimastix_PCT/1970.p1 GENE.gnl/Trimastix_PCT/1970~~gnl/Trimastix_PCT/1970.p1  ORF type:complete len:313 (+),score=96.00 gnl/Trimastix_PCT/1970:16-954(+)